MLVRLRGVAMAFEARDRYMAVPGSAEFFDEILDLPIEELRLQVGCINYRILQAFCKHVGLRPGGSKPELEARVEDYKHQRDIDGFVPSFRTRERESGRQRSPRKLVFGRRRTHGPVARQSLSHRKITSALQLGLSCHQLPATASGTFMKVPPNLMSQAPALRCRRSTRTAHGGATPRVATVSTVVTHLLLVAMCAVVSSAARS